MVTIKSYEFEKKSFNNFLSSYFMFIFHGSDKGLISELINKLKEKIGVSYDDPFSLVNLNSFEIQKNPEKLWNEVNSINLFNKKKVILIENALNEKKILDSLEEIIAKNLNKNFIIIQSKELKKDMRLRKIGEKKSSVLSISCYPDNQRTLISLIEEELLSKKRRISQEAYQILLSHLGGDRIASRNELQKLSSYCLEETLIQEEHVKDIISDTNTLYIEETVNAAICGDVRKSTFLVEKFFSSKMPAYSLLHGCFRKFQLLDKMHIETICSGESLIEIIQKFEKHGFHKRKLLLQKSLQIWQQNIVEIFLYKIDKGIQLIRKKPILEKSITSQIILLIAQTADKKLQR
ncbi:DNA polymerase III subunit delta [Candidatus Liberibacter sp.]|uniref:DNA polymerase III subunit delta n=1 Tax=Candidatus Liberibacter sp. TaxID=34022 RepID=UPI0015F7391D|nr:DNA polymerase III subunit delta [Candidatus Liberibacter sp.]MBA5723962.1 DNA polymerase III subunit delta [Candidatus Liberibacter sp.]